MIDIDSEATGRWVADVLEAARDQGGEAELTIDLGGCGLALEFGDRELAIDMTRAFAHLAPAATPPALRIVVGANDRTSRPIEAPPWGWHPAEVRGDLTRYRVHTEGLDGNAVDGGFCLVDWETATGLWWFEHSDTMYGLERAKPARLILHWLANRRGQVLLHSAAVGSRAGAVVLVGAGGSGKSTTALACLGSELRYLGDDYTMVDTSSEPAVHSLWCSGTLGPQSFVLLPHLTERVEIATVGRAEKSVLFVPPEWCADTLPVAAIVAPEVTDSDATRVVPLFPAAALIAAAPSTVLAMPGGAQSRLAAIRALAGAVPSYRMELGRDLGSIPDRLQEIIDGNAG